MLWLFSLIITFLGVVGVIKSIKNENDCFFVISIFIASTFFLIFLSQVFPN